MMKKCRDCGLEKPADLENFYKAKTCRDGLQVYCKACHAVRNIKWARAHREELAVKRAAWLEIPENREKERLRHQAARELNPDHHRSKVRASYYRHREKRLEESREHHAENRASMSAARLDWGRKNRLKDKMTRARLRSRRYGVVIEPVLPQRVIFRNGMVCGICGEKVDMKTLTFDHIVPLSSGGPHSELNLQVAHYECNRRKKCTMGYILQSEH